MTKTAQQVLGEARALLSTRMRWAKGAAAYDLRNAEVAPASPNAVRWSLTGAITRAAEGDVRIESHARRLLQARLERREPGMNLFRLNEVASHGDILALLDEVVEPPTVTRLRPD